ncbi:MAG: hypothetical protein LBL33_06810 [Tannerella sp.]|nr:hypothetical protein [Tannerella sp.]
MGKITIKHYLNTKIAPSIINDGYLKPFSVSTTGKDNEFYPLYVQITQNRKTTQIKSLTEAKLTISGFQTFVEQGTFYRKDGYYCFSEDGRTHGTRRLVRPENEIKLIKLCYEYYQGIGRQLDDNDPYTPLSTKLLRLMRGVEETLLKTAWLHIPNQETILDAFNQEYTILDSIEIIKNACGFDIYDFISPKVLMLFKSVDILSKLFGDDITYIEFISSDFESKIQSINGTSEMKRIFLYYAKFLTNSFFGAYIYSEDELQALKEGVNKEFFL